ncbi:hypothetical protein WN55_08968 [Dufourea novaeangliae]|uniref:Uncharacterized protein n=1 Tax=Dufourea novaeangliae TaxID=178035 RepID=A0A154P4V1_DUFNO|nr:hypothetical protein WN55_08968 [Dufourea novaeangliae]
MNPSFSGERVGTKGGGSGVTGSNRRARQKKHTQEKKEEVLSVQEKAGTFPLNRHDHFLIMRLRDVCTQDRGERAEVSRSIGDRLY